LAIRHFSIRHFAILPNSHFANRPFRHYHSPLNPQFAIRPKQTQIRFSICVLLIFGLEPLFPISKSASRKKWYPPFVLDHNKIELKKDYRLEISFLNSLTNL
jgi:hypothetical protein